ncbi:MAG: hypothetical protein H0U10_05480 [Chloroflexia bacterium]|nr:hypothetical protein [Chloroflexia bacterium]
MNRFCFNICDVIDGEPEAEHGGCGRFAPVHAPGSSSPHLAGEGEEAIPLLEALAGRVPPGVEPVRLRYLATAYNLTGASTQATRLAQVALRAAHMGGDVEEQVRAQAFLMHIAAHTAVDADLDGAIRLLEHCVQACDDGTVGDEIFHFGCLVDLAHALDRRSRPDAALAAMRRDLAIPSAWRRSTTGWPRRTSTAATSRR